MPRKLRLIAILLGLACTTKRASTDTARAKPPVDGPIALRNGPNPVDLLGDGTPAQAFVAWRGNYNAHGYSTVAIYVDAISDLGDSIRAWQIVPRFGGPNALNSGRELFATYEGADCMLGDLRIVQHRGGPADLIIARREFGESFSDFGATHFDYYKLARNTEQTFGAPPFFFEFVRTVEARRKYCDVNDAFQQELGLGTAGLGYWDSSR